MGAIDRAADRVAVQAELAGQLSDAAAAFHEPLLRGNGECFPLRPSFVCYTRGHVQLHNGKQSQA